MPNKTRKQYFQSIWPTIIKTGVSKSTLKYQIEAFFIVYTTQKFVTTPPMLVLASQSLNKFAYYLPHISGCYVKPNTWFFDKASTFTNKEVSLWQYKNEFLTTEYQRLLVQSSIKKLRSLLFSKLNLMFLYQNTSYQYRSALSANIAYIKYFIRMSSWIRTTNTEFSVTLARHVHSKSLTIQYKSNVTRKLAIHRLYKSSNYNVKKQRQHFWPNPTKSKTRKRRSQKPIGLLMGIQKKRQQKSLERFFKSNLNKTHYKNYNESYKLFTNIHCYLLYKQRYGRF